MNKEEIEKQIKDKTFSFKVLIMFFLCCALLGLYALIMITLILERGEQFPLSHIIMITSAIIIMLILLGVMSIWTKLKILMLNINRRRGNKK